MHIERGGLKSQEHVCNVDRAVFSAQSSALFLLFSSVPLPGGTGCALHPRGSLCSESKADD